jgi:O-antigen ligase
LIPSAHPRAFLAFLVLLIAAPLPFGSNRDWAWPILSIAILLLTVQVSTHHRELTRSAWYQLVALGLLGLWMLLQLTGLPPLMEPVSVEAALTRNDLLKTLSYACFVYLTLQLIRDTRSVDWLIYTLVLGGVLQVTLAFALVLGEADHGRELSALRASGTYASPNHLAGFLHQLLGLGTGLLIARHTRSSAEPLVHQLLSFVSGPGGRLRLLLIVLVIGLIMTLSRAGNLAFVTAIVIATAAATLASGRFNRRVALVLVSILLLDVALLGNYFGLERLQQRLGSTTLASEMRYELVGYHARIIREHGLTGTGAGTYPSVIPHYRDEAIPRRLTHAENDYLEFVMELGVPGVLCLAFFLVNALRHHWQLLGKPQDHFRWGLAFGCLLAVAAMLLHSFADFNLQIPANALLFLVALTLPVCLSQRCPIDEPDSDAA